jgi:hypothetical protein
VTQDYNPEIKQRWYTMGLLLNFEPVFIPAEDWVSE